MTQTEPLPPLERRVPNVNGSAIAHAALSAATHEAPDQTPYNETAVQKEFERAGFEKTAPYIPRHSDSLDDMKGSGRNPMKARRVLNPDEAAGGERVVRPGIDHFRTEWRQRAQVIGGSIDRIDPAARREWATLDQNDQVNDFVSSSRAAMRVRAGDAESVNPQQEGRARAFGRKLLGLTGFRQQRLHR